MNSKTIRFTGLFAAVTVGVVFVGGCAGQDSSSVTDSGRGADNVCTYTVSVGSHIGSRHCLSRSRYDAKRDAEHEQAEKNASMDSGAGGGL